MSCWPSSTPHWPKTRLRKAANLSAHIPNGAYAERCRRHQHDLFAQRTPASNHCRPINSCSSVCIRGWSPGVTLHTKSSLVAHV